MALKVTQKSERLPAGHLLPGDMIEIGVSHELKIDGDGTWVSYKIATKVQDRETDEQAHERALSYLTEKVAQTVQETVKNVQRMSE